MKRIFIVDDSNTNLLLIEDILQEEGYEVEIDDKPTRALKKIKENPPDLILLDLLMPVMDGFQFYEQLKPLAIPVIIVSADASKVKIKKAKEIGIDEYIVKPIKVKEIKNKVNEVLRNNKILNQ